MSSLERDALRILVEALELSGGRRSFVDDECRDQPALRGRVLALLEATEEAPADFLRPRELEPRPPPQPRGRVGEVVGSYRLERPLGSGGMGAVYLGTRVDGEFEHRAAIKLLHLPEQRNERRFRQERQVLASLSHPNIARLLDGGTTAAGDPYVAMELVEGEPIDTYCERRSLTVAERLRLFLQLCDAVQYAHSHGVVHGDLKPGNVFVDGEGRCRLLDFGIADLLDDQDGSTGSSHLAGSGHGLSWRYASPEQWRGRRLSTASDIYSLGVLLYRLLTGSFPYAQGAESHLGTLAAAVLDEPPARLTKESLRGRFRNLADLRQVVDTCLAKDPGRRYPSAAALGDDVENCLDHRPLSTVPATPIYRARKLVQRRPALVATTAALVVASLFYVGHLRIEQLRTQGEAKRTAAVMDALTAVFELSDSDVSEGGSIPAVSLLAGGMERAEAELAAQPQILARLKDVVGILFSQLGQYAPAEAHFADALRIGAGVLTPEELSQVRFHLALVFMQTARYREAEAIYEELQPAFESDPARREDFARLLDSRGSICRFRGETERAATFYEQAYRLRREVYGPRHELVALTQGHWALLLKETGDFDGARQMLEEAIGILEASVGARHRWTSMQLANLGGLHLERGRYVEAVPYLERAVHIKEDLYGPAHHLLASTLTDLGISRSLLGDEEEATRLLLRALDIKTEALGADHPSTAYTLETLGSHYVHLDRLNEAVDCYQRSLAIRRAAFGDTHRLVAFARVNLGGTLVDLGDLEAARHHLEKAVAVAESVEMADVNHAQLLVELANLYARGASWGACLLRSERALELARADATADAGNRVAIETMARAYLLRGDCWAGKGELQRAAESWSAGKDSIERVIERMHSTSQDNELYRKLLQRLNS